MAKRTFRATKEFKKLVINGEGIDKISSNHLKCLVADKVSKETGAAIMRWGTIGQRLDNARLLLKNKEVEVSIEINYQPQSYE